MSSELADPTADEDIRPRREINPVALIAGLLYVAIGAAVLVEQKWTGLDLGAVAGVGAVTAGIAAAALLARGRAR